MPTLVQLRPLETELAEHSILRPAGPVGVLKTLGDAVRRSKNVELIRLYDGTHNSLEKIYAENSDRWVITFSGGKDSTLTLALALDFLRLKPKCPRIDVVYADTMMEIPAMRRTASSMLSYIRKFARENRMPIRVHEVVPAVERRYWVCVIGRGYPPPKPKFRWCTKRLKIEPAEGYVDTGEPTAVLTGVRFGESAQRTGRLLASCATGGECGQDFWFQRKNGSEFVTYYAPIIQWKTCNVWDFLTFVAPGAAWPTGEVVGLYGDTNMRFGCWTCTLVRRDKTMEALALRDPSSPIGKLNEFRNQMLEESKLWRNRWARTRAGVRRKGPLSLAFRIDLLRRLKLLELETGLDLITEEDEHAIRRLWALLPRRARSALG
ncbi:MAG: phosphoadenosine phosphosulfate reductase family protein [Thermoplasmata archaeon]|nr:phosphoadenosine phosphosulfate reductase family protein [Thermoplasmata archaeon]